MFWKHLLILNGLYNNNKEGQIFLFWWFSIPLVQAFCIIATIICYVMHGSYIPSVLKPIIAL